MLARLRIATKLYLLVGVMLLGLVTVGIVALAQGRATSQSLVRLSRTELEQLVDLNTLYASGLQSGQATRNVLLNPADQKGIANYQEAGRTFDEALGRARAVAPPNVREKLDKVAELWAADNQLKLRIQELARAGQRDEATALLVKDETPKWRDVRANLLELLANQKQAFGQEERTAVGRIDTTCSLTLFLLAANLVIALLLSTLAVRSISRAITNLLAQCRTISVAVGEGRLSARGDVEAVSRELQPVLVGVNETIEAFVKPIQVTAEYVDRISKGDLPPKIDETYEGDFNLIKQNLNTCIDAVHALTEDAVALSRAAVAGKLQTRADASRHQGDYRKIVQGVNETLDAILNPIHEAAQVLETLAQRDLKARVKGSYQGDHAKIKEALNATAEALHGSMAQVAQAVEAVSSASGQIAASSEAVAAGASEQASSLEETSASLESMASMAKQAADNAQQANGLARVAQSAATEGGAAMQQMTTAMARIKASAEGTSQIIKDINEIAFQTNLLALNAAVEAARAGEAGRGFAVVAEEVRSLALRSKEAANKTESLIRQSVKEAGEGEVTATQVNAKLAEIAGSVTKVSGIVAEITATAKEQTVGIDQVAKAVMQMNQVTQQNAANSEQSSAAAAELSGQSEELAAMVGTFQLQASVAKATRVQGASSNGAFQRDAVPVSHGTKTASAVHADGRNRSQASVTA